MKIRYKYRPSKEGIQLDKIRCPVCGNPINWIKPIGDYHFEHDIDLLASCWSGSTSKEMPEHLFRIKIEGMPVVEVRRKGL